MKEIKSKALPFQAIMFTTTITSFFLVCLCLTATATGVASQQLRGNFPEPGLAAADDYYPQRARNLQSLVGCNSLARLATIRPVHETVVCLNAENNSFIAAIGPTN